jgi:HK97 family phage major capsid protein
MIGALIYNLDPAYMPAAQWMCHQGMALYLRKLRDANGRYLWKAARGPNGEDLFAGRPIVFNQYMSSTPTAGTVSLLYGQLDKIIVRDVKEVRIRRLDERYAEFDQLGLAGFLRSDWNLADAGTKPIQALTQHT